jgi:capsular exopolysaccharide synthesis family protein
MSVSPIAPASSVRAIDEVESSLFLTILRRRKRVILAFTAFATLATVALTMLQTRMYAATSAVVVRPPSWQSPTVPPNMATEAQVARSLAVAGIVINRLHLGIAPLSLVRHLSVHVPVDSDVLKFTYSSPQPKVAQVRADSFAEAYLALRRDQLESQVLASASSIQNRIEFLTDRLSALRTQIQRETPNRASILRAQANAVVAQVGLLQEKLADLNTASTTAAAVIGRAPLPKSPVRPRVALNIAVGLFAGLLLGLALAAALEYLDDRVRGPKELQERLGVPVLSSIPVSGRERNRTDGTALVTVRDSQSFVAEMFRRLRTTFLFTAADAGARSVLVSSANPREGTTFVTANLAVALAASGRSVVLVSANVRRPALEEIFRVSGDVGLLDVLLDSVDLSDALRDSGIDNLRLLEGSSALAATALSSGSTPSGAAEILGSSRASDVIDELARDFADFVLVDAPPLLAVADAAAFAPACDGVLLVVTEATTRADVSMAQDQLECARARMLGAVLLDREHRNARAAESFLTEVSFGRGLDQRHPRGGETSGLPQTAVRRQEMRR